MAALYGCAANILDKILSKKGTVKTLVIESNFPNKRKLYALVCETLKYRQVIEEIFDQTKLLRQEKQLKHSFALVLVYELLFGHGLRCGGKFKQSITKNKSSLQAALARMKVKAKVSRNEDLLPKQLFTAASIPRYVRVNTLLTNVEEVMEYFQKDDFTLFKSTDTELLLEGKRIFARDSHIPEVLVFPPSTDLHDHPLYVKGHILLQDKASCLPAHVLSPPPGSHVIDACAAPGNKTSHLAAKMNNTGKVFAFDISSHRLEVMKKQMTKAGVACVTMRNKSFLEVDPQSTEYRRVEYIVVDPSCSGSGIVSRMDNLLTKDDKTDVQQERLASLAGFQLTALKHALSFPTVNRVVYSTCSVHQEENEEVVHQALQSMAGTYELELTLQSWTNRGIPIFAGAEKCLRASPEHDHTNGFFVALFKRKEVLDGGNQTRDIQDVEATCENCKKKSKPLSVSNSRIDICTVDSSEKRRHKKRKARLRASDLVKRRKTAFSDSLEPALDIKAEKKTDITRGKKKKKRKKKCKSVVLSN